MGRIGRMAKYVVSDIFLLDKSHRTSIMPFNRMTPTVTTGPLFRQGGALRDPEIRALLSLQLVFKR